MVDLPPIHGHRAHIGAAGDQKLPGVFRGVFFQHLGPVGDAPEWVAGVGAIEQEQGGVRIVQEQLMGKPIFRLTGEIPEGKFRLDMRGQGQLISGEMPEPGAMGGFGLAKFLLGHADAEAGFAHPAVP